VIHSERLGVLDNGMSLLPFAAIIIIIVIVVVPDTHIENLYFLLAVFFSAVVFATIWALFLPPVKHSIYFNRLNTSRQDEISGIENHGAIIEDSCKK
jgi:hypothetical protein